MPVLGRSRQAILAARELHLSIYNSEIVFKYFDNYFPVNARSYPRILQALAQELKDDFAKGKEWKKKILGFVEKSGPSSAFSKWIGGQPVASRILALSLKGLPLKIVESTLNEQHYALEDWRGGSREINYRRFFDINDLAAIRIEDEKPFRWAHAKISELIKRYPIIHGLRIDHVDGLTDPEAYLRRLSKLSKNVWVEKILGEGEKLPKQWPVRGTTGYEFLGMSARLYVDLPGLMHLHSHYTRHIDRRWERFHDCVYDSKREMLESAFVSEVNSLTDQFYALAQAGRKKATFSRDDLKEALKEVTSSLRVYRTYFSSGIGAESPPLKAAFAEVEGRGHLPKKDAFNWLRSLLLAKTDWMKSSAAEPTMAALKRWEQLTGPVMAKGLEDTALYRYFPLLSLNIVGGEPDWVGDGAVEFHAYNQDRRRNLPMTLNTSSTHDTKRAEDVRARIHVISEVAEKWTRHFERWHKLNTSHRKAGDREIPERGVEYMIYETLLGAWPHDGVATPDFAERMKQYFIKAAREGKSETSWTEPDEKYENALKDFVDRLLFPKEKSGREFLKEFKSFALTCAYFGAFNSLSNVAIKVFSPGIPDFYQGSELWDLSLVDPDNRRPVDYEQRRKMLKGMKQALKVNPRAYHSAVLKNWKTGEVKLWLTWELLKLRTQNPELFIDGDYFAIEPKGLYRRHFVSFVRKLGKRWVMLVVPRFLASETEPQSKLTITDDRILSTEFGLPMGAPKVWTSHLTGRTYASQSLTAGTILEGLPMAILIGDADDESLVD